MKIFYIKTELIGFIILSLFFSLVTLNAKTIKVGKAEKFNKIADAVLSANPNDTVIVLPGKYLETNIVIDKQIVIIGLNYPEIDASFANNNIFTIKSGNVYIAGLIFLNVGVSAINDNAAIKILNSKWVVIQKNKFINTFFGIYLSKSNNCLIADNTINAYGKHETSSGNGIHLWQCQNNIITNNKISGHRDGIYFEFVKNSLIQFNVSEKNLRYGLHFMFSDSCRYLNNEFINNGAGVAVMYTKNVVMINNKFLSNWGPSSYGLLLKDINNSYISGNIFRANTIGIHAEGSSKITVEHNNFIQNGWAVKIMANCYSDYFTGNNFKSNTFDVATNSHQAFSRFEGNYWSNYNGYDINHDGTGDIPYHPVSLFSLLTSQNEPAMILLRSFFIDILDVAERVFPSITPETLIDLKPQMKEIK